MDLKQKNETVVLVHGLCGSRLDMWSLARRLRKRGYRVRNWGYWSLRIPIHEIAQRFAGELASIDNHPACQRMHVVTHSMGGIILRTVLDQGGFRKLGRVVMLAPPNRGSHVARRLSPFLNWLCPSLSQLSDSPDSYVNRLDRTLGGNVNQLGIVQATKDRVIAEDCVQLEQPYEFAKVDGHHGILPWYPDTARLVEDFLRSGSFVPASQLQPYAAQAADVI